MLRRGSENFSKKNKHEVNVHHQFHVTGSGSYYCKLPVLDFHFRNLKIYEKRRIFISSSSPKFWEEKHYIQSTVYMSSIVLFFKCFFSFINLLVIPMICSGLIHLSLMLTFVIWFFI